jgi:hypothetical protein
MNFSSTIRPGNAPMIPDRRTAQRILVGLGFAVALGITIALEYQAASAPDVASLLPADGSTVDVMELRAPPRLMELTKKLQQAAAKDPQWWLTHTKTAMPGEPLPYDARSGFTKEEYREFLSLGSKLTLVKVNTINVKVKRDQHRITLTFGEDLPGLEEVVLDTKADTVTTPLGIAAARSLIKASEAQKATGPWNGIQWQLERAEKEPVCNTVVRLALGKLKDSGRGMIYYDVKEITEESRTRRFHILQYEITKTQ